jgi:DNA-binding PadR family transcriptional regulator
MNKKILRGAILESILLKLINGTSNRGLYGYAISIAVHKKFGIRLGSSTIYGELKQLEKHGLVTSNWELTPRKARRQYRITQKGQNLLKEYSLELKTVIPAFVTCEP